MKNFPLCPSHRKRCYGHLPRQRADARAGEAGLRRFDKRQIVLVMPLPAAPPLIVIVHAPGTFSVLETFAFPLPLAMA